MILVCLATTGFLDLLDGNLEQCTTTGNLPQPLARHLEHVSIDLTGGIDAWLTQYEPTDPSSKEGAEDGPVLTKDVDARLLGTERDAVVAFQVPEEPLQVVESVATRLDAV